MVALKIHVCLWSKAAPDCRRCLREIGYDEVKGKVREIGIGSVNPRHKVELLYGNITLIRRLMNDGPRSVRVPRLNLIRALNLLGREHDGMPYRMCARREHEEK